MANANWCHYWVVISPHDGAHHMYLQVRGKDGNTRSIADYADFGLKQFKNFTYYAERTDKD